MKINKFLNKIKIEDRNKFKTFCEYYYDDNYYNIIKNCYSFSLLAKTKWKKVKNGMPIQYVCKHAYFYGEKFIDNKNVLIPRFDSEILLEEAFNVCKNNKINSCLDLCCGSGVLAVSIKKNINIQVDASDISSAALRVSKRNAKQHLTDVKFIKSDLFIKIEKKYDLIVCNPPYIPFYEKSNLDKEVVNFEPHLALFAKDNGLWFYNEILKNADSYLTENGYLCFEIGIGQANDILKFMPENFRCEKIVKDLDNIERVLVLKKERNL